MKAAKIQFPFQAYWDASRYPRAFLLGGPAEEDVQRQIVEGLRLLGVRAHAVDAGYRRVRGAVIRVLRELGLERLAVRFMNALDRACPPAEAGFSDLSGVIPGSGRAFYLEVKAPARHDLTGRVTRTAGSASAEQLAFLVSRHKDGAAVGVVWSLDDARAILGV